jgi:SAM-dependent methyltransferase
MQTTDTKTLLEHMAVLADPVRCRLLFLLDERELAVSDLCAVLQLPQSTVSRHLKTLSNSAWLGSRRDGTRHLYRNTVSDLSEGAQRLWALTRVEVEQSPAGISDRKRLDSILARQRSRSQEFFDVSGSQWDALRDELFGRGFHLSALPALLPDDAVVADLGAGTGTVTEALAPFVGRVIGVDASTAMLGIAAERLERFQNVELRHGELTALPIDDGNVDVATLMLVLHHIESPESAINEASRVLKPGGRILIVDMLPHDRAEYRQDMGHVWLGFPEETIKEHVTEAGFEAARFVMLPPDPEAKGPNLFAVSAIKKER